jgi:hypothetical protein
MGLRSALIMQEGIAKKMKDTADSDLNASGKLSG